jgi:hypothetical protein
MATLKTQTPALAGRSAGVREYIKRAFLYRWNMLLFVGGLAAAVMSPWPDAVLPLVAAAEAAYLGGLIASPKFRSAIDAQVYQEARQPGAPAREAPRSLQQMVAALPLESRRRFEQVRERCLEMRGIANQVRGRTGEGQPAEDLNTSALDRLLWVFLRLLVSQEALNRFLLRTNPDEIRLRLGEAKAKLELQTAQGDERMTRSLQDSVAAHELRLDNYNRAQKNADFVRVELDRIEAKIHALTESAVNRQDPDMLSSQIDSVAESMQTTERAISELQHITGLVDELQEPPPILESDVGRVTES